MNPNASYVIVCYDRTAEVARSASPAIVFWRQDGDGYTANPFHAGLFSLDDLRTLSLSPVTLVIPISFFKHGFGEFLGPKGLVIFNQLITGLWGGFLMPHLNTTNN